MIWEMTTVKAIGAYNLFGVEESGGLAFLLLEEVLPSAFADINIGKHGSVYYSLGS